MLSTRVQSSRSGSKFRLRYGLPITKNRRCGTSAFVIYGCSFN